MATRLFGGLPKRYEALAQMLALGQYRRWRTVLVDRLVAGNPASVLDVATGTAGVAIAIARRTQATVTGIDITEAMLFQARHDVDDLRLSGRIRLLRGRAENLPFPDASFDALTFTYLLRYVEDPASTLMELARVVRPGGTMASLEFHIPPCQPWRGLWWLYTRLLLPVAGLIGGRAWFDVGRFLGPSISRHYRSHPLASTVSAWQDAGMTDVRWTLQSLGGSVVMWGRRRGA